MIRFQLLVALLVIAVATARAQTKPETKAGPQRGMILLETEYNLIGTLLGGGSGLNIVSSGGSTVVGLGLDGGYFLADRTALLFKLGLLTADGVSLTQLGTGVKQYFGGVVPVGAELGLLLGSGDGGGGGTALSWSINGGYAARLADNIYFEPFVGVIGFDGETAFQAGTRFAMFLGEGR